jgi:hypothetical protein
VVSIGLETTGFPGFREMIRPEFGHLTSLAGFSTS